MKKLIILIGVLSAMTIIINGRINNQVSAAPIPNRSLNLPANPNIIVIYTDDQRWDTICLPGSGIDSICSQPRSQHPMPFLERMAGAGIVFQNAYASNPNCCPARASFLSGGYYTKHTQVLDNNDLNGSAQKFIDSTSLATRLQQNGYETAFIGRYMNGYETLVDENANTSYIPPGWSSFTGWARHIADTRVDIFSQGSSTPDGPTTGTTFRAEGYLTDILRDQALDYITNTTDPYFLFLSFTAPHFPGIPAPRHQNLFSTFEYHDRGWGELPAQDMNDKPQYLQTKAQSWPGDAEQNYYRTRLGNLRSVDESLEALFLTLDNNRQLENTIIIFTSDQGFTWGEHQITDKHIPYEESIRTPLIIFYLGATHQILPNLVSTNIDVPATILHMAGLNPKGDGTSLLPLIDNPQIPWREALFFEHYDRGDGYFPSWTAVLTESNFKYVEYATGEKELYDLNIDPYELDSKHNDPVYAPEMNALAQRLNTDWSRGLAVVTDGYSNPDKHILLNAPVGQLYNHQFNAWGGDGNYSWSYYTGTVSLPRPTNLASQLIDPGSSSLSTAVSTINCQQPKWVTLSSTGLLTGTPPLTGSWLLCITVTDTSVSPQPGNGRPMQHNLIVQINATP